MILSTDFMNLVNEKQGIVSAKIKTAVEISDKEKSAITRSLKHILAKI